MKAYSQLKVGDPLDKDTLYGPLHTKRSVELFLKAIDDAKRAGGQVLCGGKVKIEKEKIKIWVKFIFLFHVLYLENW